MKTKNTFSPGDQVLTAVATGIVKESANFTDHTEHLIEWPDQTASWINEQNLTAIEPLQETGNQKL